MIQTRASADATIGPIEDFEPFRPVSPIVLSSRHLAVAQDFVLNGHQIAACPEIKMHIVRADEWDEAVAGFDGICQEQTWTFGHLRWPSLQHEPMLFTRDGEIVGGSLMKIQRLPFGVGSVAISKWGPMLRHADHPDRAAIFRGMIAAMMAEYADRRGLMLSILPRGATSNRNDEFDTLMSLGFRAGSNAPFPDRYFVNLAIDEAAQRASLNQKWRYHLRKSESAGLTFEHAGAERIGEFARIYDSMSARKKFPDYSAYQTVPDLFTLPDALRPELFFVRQGDEQLAGAIVFKAGDTATYLYGATTDRALPLRAGYLLHWHIIRWLKQNTRATWYDLGGTDGFLGLHQFKKGMVGEAGVISALPPMANYATRKWPFLVGTGAFAARDIVLDLRHRLLLRLSNQARPDQSRRTCGRLMSRARRAIAIPARLASRSAAIFGLRLFGAAIVFGTQAVMARWWGPQLLGHYLLTIAAINLLAALMPLGFQVIGTYFAAEYRAHGDAATLRAFARRAYGHIALTAAAAVAIGLAAAPFAASTVFDPIHEVGVPAFVMATATAVVFVNGALLVGMKHPVAGFVADTLFRPLAMAAGLVVAFSFAGASSGLNVMMWSAATAYGGVALVHAVFTLRAMRKIPEQGVSAAAPTGRWWRFALPWIFISIATDFFFDIDLILLASLMSIEDLAVFGVCTRVFSLIAFGVAAVYAVTMPEFLDAQARRDDIGFQRKIADANLIATAFAAAASCAMLFAGPVLKLFGPAFAAGATPLALLCVGLTIRSMMGPAALVLSIHDRPYASFPAIALGLVVLIAGNYLLVPMDGLTGAATAASLSIALWSVAQWGIALRHTGVDVSIWPRLREMLVNRRASRAI